VYLWWLKFHAVGFGPRFRRLYPQKAVFAATLTDKIGGLCSVFADVGYCSGIVKFVTQFQPNKIHYPFYANPK